ncbi:hypothetical protein BATDEDRAFT_27250 [Batrachochytrium dendrobatidis JAM81]|uniref:Uncharacterized protein n=2 Tax=Batrachochytrium dendrobatidis TaxID=109871 RepID=F4PAC8_BATDJ|nr:uncharacterized protein BATDEDRAFT_27250 [Batrachochytrium dendrobatidis JAM81]EGF78047.1 hypothetical protein BATDEDRAFT_27250 [Batrachochytrium dendrobatidis JAM81]KAJ8330059.1 hypothetical protein O5D80_001636 [Batrachochytrium dendrobatidis]KAK5670521.1 hypothetical protein QVD99_003201 [Batrachochytrium dendrobatidis]OAJ44165.1 hypothetical protein BDEG_27431 [Batrachochytrium dendrobatidis JEL423]|eukprot:XP_006681420.1 hypothetical protein BATDEDRAFT_27250 [Batrachochytrium dendrobatidis JAM81]
MKLPTAVLSSILLICSVTIAKPIRPSSTTSAESSPSLIPVSGPVDWSDVFSASREMRGFLKSYLEIQSSYDEHKKECDLIELRHNNYWKMINFMETRISELKSKALKDRTKLKNDDDDAEIKKLEKRLEEKRSDFVDLKRQHNGCKVTSDCFDQELILVKTSIVQYFMESRFDQELLEKQFSQVLSNSIIKKCLDELCQESSACSGGSDQDPEPLPQIQPESSSFGQRFASFKQRFATFGQGFSSLKQRFTTFRQKASTGLRKVASKLSHGANLLLSRIRREPKDN